MGVKRRLVELALIGAALVALGFALVQTPPRPTGFEAPWHYAFHGHVVPVAVSFASPSDGFELGWRGCRRCKVLRLTSDGGRTWHSPPPLHDGVGTPVGNEKPPVVADWNLVFADPQDGWEFGPAERSFDRVAVTHDGPSAFEPESLPPIVGVQVGGGDAYALATSAHGRAMLWRTPVYGERWKALKLPSIRRDATFAVAAAGALMVLRIGYGGPGPGSPGALWFSKDRGRTWQRRVVPCHQGGATLISAVTSMPSGWLLECYSNMQSSMEQHTLHRLYVTTDNGARWRRLSVPTHRGGPELLAGTSDGHYFLATESGGGDQLVGSFDGGRHWHVLLSHTGYAGWADLHFLNDQTGFIVGPSRAGSRTGTPNRVYRTDDGGRHWKVIAAG